MNESSLLAFSISITGPIFMVVLVGLLLKRLGVIQPQFIQPASDLVFKVGLPVILFLSIYRADLENFSMALPLAIAIPMTLVLFVLSIPVGRLFIKDKADCGVFIQGAFRGNLAVISWQFSSNRLGILQQCLWRIGTGNGSSSYRIINYLIQPTSSSSIKPH